LESAGKTDRKREKFQGRNHEGGGLPFLRGKTGQGERNSRGAERDETVELIDLRGRLVGFEARPLKKNLSRPGWQGGLNPTRAGYLKKTGGGIEKARKVGKKRRV